MTHDDSKSIDCSIVHSSMSEETLWEAFCFLPPLFFPSIASRKTSLSVEEVHVGVHLMRCWKSVPWCCVYWCHQPFITTRLLKSQHKWSFPRALFFKAWRALFNHTSNTNWCVFKNGSGLFCLARECLCLCLRYKKNCYLCFYLFFNVAKAVCFWHGKPGASVSICIVSNMFGAEGSGCGKATAANWWECVNG